MKLTLHLKHPNMRRLLCYITPKWRHILKYPFSLIRHLGFNFFFFGNVRTGPNIDPKKSKKIWKYKNPKILEYNLYKKQVCHKNVKLQNQTIETLAIACMLF